MNGDYPSLTPLFFWCTFFLSLFYMTSNTCSFTHNYLTHRTLEYISPQSKAVAPAHLDLTRSFYNVWRTKSVLQNVKPLIYLSPSRSTYQNTKVTTYSNGLASSSFLYTKSVFYGSNRRGNLLKLKDTDITLVWMIWHRSTFLFWSRRLARTHQLLNLLSNFGLNTPHVHKHVVNSKVNTRFISLLYL